MEKRRFGRTEHDSALAVFGAVALRGIGQSEADRVMEHVINAGINHIDVAPSYGDAEALLGPWMPRIRKDIFLGCKTMARTEEEAIREFRESKTRLRVDTFDLYQLHAITDMAELDQVTQKGGALDGVRKMRQAGLTRFIGITGHGMRTPMIFIEALKRFDFDSVLFPINPTLFADPDYREQALTLLDLCEEKDVGVMAIKSVARQPWGERERTYHTWYMPFDERTAIKKSVNFVLSQKLTHLCTPGDHRLLPDVINACENFAPLTEDEQNTLIEQRETLETIF